jgi:hypothetical protein
VSEVRSYIEPEWRQKAREMRASQANWDEIAEACGKSVPTVQQFMSRDGGFKIETDGSSIDSKPFDMDVLSDENFIEKHVYRTIRKIDMGPVATKALADMNDRRKLRERAGIGIPFPVRAIDPIEYLAEAA